MGPRRILIQEDTIPMFIEEVKKRECLWNHDNEKYNDRYEAMVAWRELAQLMDQPEEVLKAKWKNLRDLFKREFKVQKRKWKTKIESLDEYRGKWKFFHAMWFIHRPGDAVTNDLEDEINEDTYLGDDDDENNPLQHFVKCEPVDNTEDEVFVEEESSVSSRKRKRDDDNDFDMMFLKSLTPYFRQLEPMRKLIVRSKIQDILINEIAAQQVQTNRNNKIS